MTTAAQSGFGTTLTKSGSTKIVELTSIGGPTIGRDTIDVTNNDSADSFREFLAGIGDGGEISLEGNFIPSSALQTALITDLISGLKASYTIAYPDTKTTWVADCLCTGFEPSQPFDDKIGFSATLKISGKPVFTYTP